MQIKELGLQAEGKQSDLKLAFQHKIFYSTNKEWKASSKMFSPQGLAVCHEDFHAHGQTKAEHYLIRHNRAC